MGRETSTKTIVVIDIILTIAIEFFFECYLNLLSVGDPNYICESYMGRVGEGKIWFRSSEKSVHFKFVVTYSSTVKWDEQH